VRAFAYRARVRYNPCMTDSPWYTRFFGDDYLRVHEPYLFPERTKQELIGMLTLLGSAEPPLPEGGALLDLCCGQGRHSIPLAALGYRVTGLDLSKTLLSHARTSARQNGVAVNWVQSDMRRIPARDEFDAAINIFNTFGYLESEDEDRAALEEVRRALKPGGLFLLETVGRDTVVRHYMPAAVDRHADGLLVAQEQAFDQRTSHLEVRLTLIEPEGARREYEQSIRIYTPIELVRLFEQAGLRVEGVFGGLDGSDLTLDSLRLVILARRPSI
jgi:SAM-dependent methyltransferase